MVSSARRWAVPSIIAVLVLGTLAMIIGWQLGLRDVQTPRTVGSDTPSTGTSRPSGASSLTAVPAGPACPAATVNAAHDAGGTGDVTQVLYIRTKTADVWICTDATGKLFYQGHVGTTTRNFSKATSSNTLFLTDVVISGDSFAATNTASDGEQTVYTVSKQRLVVVQGTQTISDEPVKSFS